MFVAPPASAHSNDITGAAVCQNNGTWTITWTVANDYGLTAQVTETSNASVVSVGTPFGKYETKTFSQTVATAQKYTLTVTTKWSDNYSRSNNGSVTISGTCEQPGALLGGSETYCVNAETGANVTVTWEGATYGGTVSKTQAEATVVLNKATAYRIAEIAMNAPTGACSGLVPGGSETYCKTAQTGQNVTVTWAGARYGGSVTKSQAQATVASNKTIAYREAGIAMDAPTGACSGTVPGGSDTFCVDGGLVTVTWPGAEYGDGTDLSYGDAVTLVAENKADALHEAGIPEGTEPSECSPPPTTPPTSSSFTQSATVGGSIDLCLVDGTTNLVVAYSGTGSGTSGISDADAIFIANTNANAAAAADLAAKTPAGATEGACGAPLAVAAVEAATVPEEPIVVAAPESATVPEAEPVSVPQAATVPTAVPAGDGSSDRSGPNSGLLILALVATGVCFLATGRLLATRNR